MTEPNKLVSNDGNELLKIGAMLLVLPLVFIPAILLHPEIYGWWSVTTYALAFFAISILPVSIMGVGLYFKQSAEAQS